MRRTARTTRLVAYVRAPAGVGASHDAYARSLSAVEGWARAHRAAVAHTAVEPADVGIGGAGDRVGFLRALTLARDGDADAIGIASLVELDPDLVVQELLLAEARASRVAVVSAEPADEGQLCDPPHDPARALVRRVIEAFPRFQGEMRSLRAWVRRRDTLADLDQIAPALVAFEAMQEHGDGTEPLRMPGHRLATLLRLRRA